MDMNKKPYCIQRAKFEIRDYKKGIDSFLNLDYMGSSEFEFGALPQSLERIRGNIDNYGRVEMIEFKRDNNLHFLLLFYNHTKYTQEGLIQILNDLYDGKITLQEYSAFDISLNPQPHNSTLKDTDFWWDIDNDWMVWKSTDYYETKCHDFIKTLREISKKGE